MKSAFTVLAGVALAASSAFAQLRVETPFNPVVCQPLLLSWGGGTPPYFLVLFSIFPAGQTSSPLVDFGQVNGTTLTWKVNIAAGTQIGLTIRDQTGSTAQSAPFPINAGSDTSCLGQTLVTSAGTAPATTAGNTATGSAPPGTTAPPTPTTTNGGGANTSTKPTSAAGTNTSGAPKPSSSNAASTQAASFGAAAMMGAAAIALFA